MGKIRWQITLADMMQPFQYNLRCPAAKDNSTTHAAVAPSSLHAAITMQPCNIRFQIRISRRTWQHKTTTIMQPLQCVLQAKIPKHNVTAMCKNKQNTSKQPLHCGLLPALAEPSPHLPRARGTFHRRPEPLYPKKHKVSCPGFLPKRSPCNIHAAIAMRLATSGSTPASLDAHGNTKRQQSCSHYNAICNQRVKIRKESRTHEQPLVAEHRGGTFRARLM